MKRSVEYENKNVKSVAKTKQKRSENERDEKKRKKIRTSADLKYEVDSGEWTKDATNKRKRRKNMDRNDDEEKNSMREI